MNRDELLNTLKTLHTQLSSLGEIDAETQTMLQTVTSDIQNVLDSGSAAQVDDDSGKSLSERLRDTLIEFEARHPHVGGLLERITDGLASMGI
jgi:hypothetical protein